MKKNEKIMAVFFAFLMMLSVPFTACAEETQQKLPENPVSEAAFQREASKEDVIRNTVFTSVAQMQQLMGTSDPSVWSIRYLSQVEQNYWNFSAPGEQDNREISINLASNAYQNLEMFLDNGYLLDYNELAAYAADYLVRKGEEDTYYKILTDCLKNPYLLNKPEAQVTDYTYNGRDYSAVFDPDYYYDNNPELQRTIGFNPPELLRHFVEKGIMEGRRGRAELDMDAYIAAVDAQIAASVTAQQTMEGQLPAVAKYSYSRANYYGRLLGHYDYSEVYAPETTGMDEENTIDW